MTNPASAFLPAIEALEKEYADIERNANALLTSINLLRSKAGMPPRAGGFVPADGAGTSSAATSAGVLNIPSDAFTGKTMGAAVRQYLEMRERAGMDRPANTREILDALKDGGFSSKAKDDEVAMTVLRTTMRKNPMFVKLENGKYGLRSWYGIKPAKQSAAKKADDVDGNADGDEPIVVDSKGNAKAA